jgi:hypothetical protein
MLQAMTDENMTVRTQSDVIESTAVRQQFDGHVGIVFDASTPPGGIDGYVALSSIPGVSVSAHTRSWLQGSQVVTVASDSAWDRDDFAKNYLSQ